jgi:hypothetical protein
MSTDQLFAITGTIAIITDGPVSALAAAIARCVARKRQRSHIGSRYYSLPVRAAA